MVSWYPAMRDPRRYIIMMTTVVDYPAAFEVPSEYDPICDARWARPMGSDGSIHAVPGTFFATSR